MVKNLYLIRHGETEGSHERRYKGTIDVPLSERGRRQAEATGGYMKRMGLRPETVYSSPLVRAHGSAELVAGHFALEPKVVPELRERDFGVWEGMTFDEINHRWPEAFGSWADNPLKFSPMNGESTLEVRDRIVPVIDRLVRDAEHESIAVVAHGGVNRVVLCHYTGVPLENIFRVEQGFACLNVIRFYDGLPVLDLMNYTPEVQ